MEKIFNVAANKGGIYQIRNKNNGKVYVGSTNRFKQRIAEHETSLRNNKHQNKHLQYAFNQYGEDAFVFEVLKVVNDSLKQRRIIEENYIKEIFGTETCYNIRKYTSKKEGQWLSTPEETRKKMSQNSKKRVGNLNPFYGKNHSDEAKNKMKEAAARRQPVTEETRKKISESLKGHRPWNKGRKASKETRHKQSKALKGRKPKNLEQLHKKNIGKQRTEEAKNKMSEAKKGKKRKPFSAETIKKMKEAWIKRKQQQCSSS